MLNHIVIMGRLTRDPELRYTQSGLPVASFSVAVDRDIMSRDSGEKQTDFINVVAWRSTGEFVSKYFNKGSMIVVSGRLQMRNWNDREGNKRTTAEIVAENVYFGESKRRDDSSYGNGGGYRQSGASGQGFGGYSSSGGNGGDSSYSPSGGYSSAGGSGADSSYSSGFSSVQDGGSPFKEVTSEEESELPF